MVAFFRNMVVMVVVVVVAVCVCVCGYVCVFVCVCLCVDTWWEYGAALATQPTETIIPGKKYSNLSWPIAIKKIEILFNSAREAGVNTTFFIVDNTDHDAVTLTKIPPKVIKK